MSELLDENERPCHYCASTAVRRVPDCDHKRAWVDLECDRCGAHLGIETGVRQVQP
jgi:hypothetical protein